MNTLTGEQALDIAADAEAITALVNNPIWQEKVVKVLLDKFRLHHDSLTSRELLPEKTREHLEAYHLLREFLPSLDKALKGKDKKLRQWMEQTGGVL